MTHNNHKHSLNWQRLTGMRPVARAVVAVVAIATVATGITYAILQSQNASLTNNSISTASADLKIGTTTNNFSSSRSGFTFANIIPGAVPAASDGNLIYLKNFGSVPLALKVYMGSQPVNDFSVSLDKVFLHILRTDSITNEASQKLSLAEVIAAAPNGLPLDGTLAVGATAQYRLQISMDDRALGTPTATIGGLDFVFTGTAVPTQ